MRKVTLYCCIVLGAGLLAAGCATRAAGSRPDEMSRAGHQRAAQKERDKSKHHAKRYDPDAERTKAAGGQATADAPDWTDFTYNPTAVHLQHARLHKDHAKQHEAAAKALEGFESKQCKRFSAKTRTQCPLVQVTRTENIPGGVRMHFAKSVPLAAVIAHANCHHAFARTQGHHGMPSCPLYLKQTRVTNSKLGHGIEITTDNEKQVAELRRRAQLHVGGAGPARKK